METTGTGANRLNTLLTEPILPRVEAASTWLRRVDLRGSETIDRYLRDEPGVSFSIADLCLAEISLAVAGLIFYLVDPSKSVMIVAFALLFFVSVGLFFPFAKRAVEALLGGLTPAESDS